MSDYHPTCFSQHKSLQKGLRRIFCQNHNSKSWWKSANVPPVRRWSCSLSPSHKSHKSHHLRGAGNSRNWTKKMQKSKHDFVNYIQLLHKEGKRSKLPTSSLTLLQWFSLIFAHHSRVLRASQLAEQVWLSSHETCALRMCVTDIKSIGGSDPGIPNRPKRFKAHSIFEVCLFSMTGKAKWCNFLHKMHDDLDGFGWFWGIDFYIWIYLDDPDFPSEESDFIGKRCSSQIDGPQITSNIFQKLSLQQAVGRHSNILRFARCVTDLLGFVTFFSDVRSFRHFGGFPCLRHFAKFGSSTTISSNAPSRSQKTPKSEFVKKTAFFCGFSADLFFGEKNDFRV